ncbi:hypothetical protein FSS13T_18340 [Flavobacterium saliperosum S13]|uniref:Uncharacterized protein n=1 Tax=Flavobacterium saliperosum S13 TaxID=1341155 RepID=A0ABN0QG56_9FLAO|nr:hypothetical protein FSS13T_18340 [Flavobacterium saliperosum S13]
MAREVPAVHVPVFRYIFFVFSVFVTGKDKKDTAPPDSYRDGAKA